MRKRTKVATASAEVATASAAVASAAAIVPAWAASRGSSTCRHKDKRSEAALVLCERDFRLEP